MRLCGPVSPTQALRHTQRERDREREIDRELIKGLDRWQAGRHRPLTREAPPMKTR